MSKQKLSVYAVVALALVSLIAVDAYFEGVAENRDWILKNRVPTRCVADSLKLGVYEAKVEFAPPEVDLGDTSYKIDEAWVEHVTTSQQVSRYVTRQYVYPDLILCIKTSIIRRNTQLAKTDIDIKDAVHHQIVFKGREYREYNEHKDYRVLFTEIGRTVPKNVVLWSKERDREVVVELARSDPSEGAGVGH
jgi:hypothetical protein